MSVLITHTNPELFRLSYLLWKQSVQLEWLALWGPVQGSCLGTGQRITATCPSSSNVSPVQVSQVCDIQTSHRQEGFFEWRRPITEPTIGETWPLQLPTFKVPSHMHFDPCIPLIRSSATSLPAVYQLIWQGNTAAVARARLPQIGGAASQGPPDLQSRPRSSSLLRRHAGTGHMFA